MNALARIALSTGIVIAAAIHPATSKAAWDVVKPDLQIKTMAPSPLGPDFVRVVVVNVGPAASGACHVRVAPQGSTLLFYHAVPALAACTNPFAPPAYTVDVELNGASPLTPGQVLYGSVDCFGVVAEKNETNNGYTYVG